MKATCEGHDMAKLPYGGIDLSSPLNPENNLRTEAVLAWLKLQTAARARAATHQRRTFGIFRFWADEVGTARARQNGRRGAHEQSIREVQDEISNTGKSEPDRATLRRWAKDLENCLEKIRRETED